MITGKLIAGGGDLSEVQSIRMRVFVDEQGFPADEEMDQYDARAVHALLYDDDHNPAATGRLYIDDDGYWRIGRVAVLKEKRGAQLGDLVMRMLLYRVLEMNLDRVKLSCAPDLAPFFMRYGFRKTAQTGESLIEMQAENAEINIEGTCKHCAEAR